MVASSCYFYYMIIIFYYMRFIFDYMRISLIIWELFLIIWENISFSKRTLLHGVRRWRLPVFLLLWELFLIIWELFLIIWELLWLYENYFWLYENFWLYEKILASQRELCSMVLEGGFFLFSRTTLPSFTTLLLQHMTLQLSPTHSAQITIQKHHC